MEKNVERVSINKKALNTVQHRFLFSSSIRKVPISLVFWWNFNRHKKLIIVFYPSSPASLPLSTSTCLTWTILTNGQWVPAPPINNWIERKMKWTKRRKTIFYSVQLWFWWPQADQWHLISSLRSFHSIHKIFPFIFHWPTI